MTDKQLTMDEVERILWTDVVMSICGHQPFCWPRHRWTGFDKALQDVGRGLDPAAPEAHRCLRLQEIALLGLRGHVQKQRSNAHGTGAAVEVLINGSLRAT